MSETDDLRRLVSGTVAVWHGTLPLEHLQALVDAVLALPALRDVVAERDRLRETVARVEALRAEWASVPNAYRFNWHVAELRRALDSDA